MNKIVFATNNQHKLEEIRSILGEDFEVLSLSVCLINTVMRVLLMTQDLK